MRFEEVFRNPQFRVKYGNWVGVSSEPTIYGLRCRDIENQLCSHKIKAKVSRHHLKKHLFYDIEVNTTDGYIDEKEIAEALGISNECVDFIHIDTKNKYIIYWIDEKQLNKKYMDCTGRLVFDRLDSLRSQAKIYLEDEEYFVTEIINDCGNITVKLVKNIK